ncbi:SAF domain-containing protein [Gorillibacterium sp. sgz500922]|uniref:SAF domain-containing protein n=1 Tax=Gorillibacterium sp. sgz500922 TaxID=3446694 RepID=UPI003F678BC6
MFESKRRALIFFFLSMAAALAAVFLFSGYVQRTKENMGEMVPVMVAKKPIMAGQDITPDMLGTRQVPKKYVLPSLLKSADELRAKRSAVAVAEGDLLTSSMLVDTTLVTGELRQIQLRAPLAVFDDTIQFNDKVDLLYTYELPGTTNTGGGQQENRQTKLLFENVTVNSVTKTDNQITALGIILPLSDSPKMVWALNYSKEVRVLKRNGDTSASSADSQAASSPEPQGPAASASPGATPSASPKASVSPKPSASPSPKATAKSTAKATAKPTPKPSATPKK